MSYICKDPFPRDKCKHMTNVLKIGLNIESKKLSIHGSLVESAVEARLNR